MGKRQKTGKEVDLEGFEKLLGKLEKALSKVLEEAESEGKAEKLSETERARLNLSLFKSIASMYAMLLQCEGDGKEKDPTSSYSVRVELSRADALLELVGSAPQSAKTNR